MLNPNNNPKSLIGKTTETTLLKDGDLILVHQIDYKGDGFGAEYSFIPVSSFILYRAEKFLWSFSTLDSGIKAFENWTKNDAWMPA